MLNLMYAPSTKSEKAILDLLECVKAPMATMDIFKQMEDLDMSYATFSHGLSKLCHSNRIRMIDRGIYSAVE